MRLRMMAACCVMCMGSMMTVQAQMGTASAKPAVGTAADPAKEIDGMLGLFEAPPQFVYDNFTLPQDWAMSKLINSSDQFNDDVSRAAATLGRKGEGHIEVRDRVPARQERKN